MKTETEGPFDWKGRAKELISGAPEWALLVTGGVLLALAVLVGLVVWTRKSNQRAEQNRLYQEAVTAAVKEGNPLPPEPLHMDPKPLLGGIAVSLYGLWGFATETAELPLFFALAFMSMFDILQLRLFSQMYKMADPERGWTRQLRTVQGTTWAFVLLSAVANFQHAPNIWSAPWLAAMPIGAAWVMQVPLKNALAGVQAEEKQPEGAKPGPGRLIALLWRRIWAWCFRVFGMDVSDRADTMVRRARARDAADASYALRTVLLEKQALEDVVRQAATPGDDGHPAVSRSKLQAAQKRLEVLTKELEKKVRPKAQTALELADTHDPEQGLALFQRMAWLTNVDEVAMLDYGPDSPAMEKLEQLNVAANADFIKSSKRARDAEARAEEAETARLAAEEEIRRATEKLVEAEKALERMRQEAKEAQARAAADWDAEQSRIAMAREKLMTDLETEEKRLAATRDERLLLESSDASVTQLYQRTTEELDGLKQQLSTLERERTQLTTAYTTLEKQARTAQETALRLEGEHKGLSARLESLTEDRNRFAGEAEEAREAAELARSGETAAREELLRVRAKLEALEAVPHAVPARTQRGPRIQVPVEEGTPAETREQVRTALKSLTPEERELSQHKVAALIEPHVPIKADAIRRHLRAIANEDQAGLPGQRPADETDGE
ncbi:hypothetical protein ACFYUJ_38910 [Streptomyces sp. NPDC004520]|uniref:hypothetical protein n=1 Tax=Streptomyces sp. NPDC004520 TaxID=3364702 RepID=UPI0036C7AE0F